MSSSSLEGELYSDNSSSRLTEFNQSSSNGRSNSYYGEDYYYEAGPPSKKFSSNKKIANLDDTDSTRDNTSKKSTTIGYSYSSKETTSTVIDPSDSSILGRARNVVKGVIPSNPFSYVADQFRQQPNDPQINNNIIEATNPEMSADVLLLEKQSSSGIPADYYNEEENPTEKIEELVRRLSSGVDKGMFSSKISFNKADGGDNIVYKMSGMKSDLKNEIDYRNYGPSSMIDRVNNSLNYNFVTEEEWAKMKSERKFPKSKLVKSVIPNEEEGQRIMSLEMDPMIIVQPEESTNAFQLTQQLTNKFVDMQNLNFNAKVQSSSNDKVGVTSRVSYDTTYFRRKDLERQRKRLINQQNGIFEYPQNCGFTTWGDAFRSKRREDKYDNCMINFADNCT